LRRVKLNDISEKIDYGLTEKAKKEKVGPKFLRITDIQNNRVDWDTVPFCKCDDKEFEKNKLETGDIVFARTGATTGKSFLIDELYDDAVYASYLIRLRLKQDEVLPEFVSYFFNSDVYWRQIYADSDGATLPSFNATKLKKLEIPLPSLSEQKAIVAKLDRAQRLIDIDREMLAKYDELIQSVFLEMFGDPVRNEKGWEVKVFSKVFDITTGKLNSNAAVEDGKYPFFTCSREISWIDNYAFNTEALLLAGNNASGDFNIKYYNGKFNAYQRTYVLTSEENYGFLKIALDYFLNQMKSDSIGTNTKYLTLTLLDRIKIPIPPIELQKNFNDIVMKIDNEKRILTQQQVKKSEELFSSLVQGFFGN